MLLNLLGFRNRFARVALRTVKFVEQPLVEAKCLLPAVELVSRLLRLFLVRAKIQSNVTVSHDSSLRRWAIHVKFVRSGGVLAGQAQFVAVGVLCDWRIVGNEQAEFDERACKLWRYAI